MGGICGAISLAADQNIFDNIKISKSYNYGAINGLQYIGGIAGRIYTSSNVEYCFNKGKIVGENVVGGISGDVVKNNSKIYSCYNFGEINGKNNFGGLCGTLENYIENSYFIGKIIYNSSSKYYGTLFGTMKKTSQCKNCYYLNTSGIKGTGYEETTGLSDSIIGKTTEELKGLAQTLGDAYEQNNNLNEGYPYLKENKPIK